MKSIVRVVLRDHVPLFKLVEQLQLGHTLQLLRPQLILVDVVKVLGAGYLPARSDVPATQSRHAVLCVTPPRLQHERQHTACMQSNEFRYSFSKSAAWL
jgi:hypothetical protein